MAGQWMWVAEWCCRGGFLLFWCALPFDAVMMSPSMGDPPVPVSGFVMLLYYGIVFPMWGAPQTLPVTVACLLTLASPLERHGRTQPVGAGNFWIAGIMAMLALGGVILVGLSTTGRLLGYWLWAAAVLLAMFGLSVHPLARRPR